MNLLIADRASLCNGDGRKNYMDIGTTIALIVFMICISAPNIIESIKKEELFQRRSKRIKDLEKKIEELEKGRK